MTKIIKVKDTFTKYLVTDTIADEVFRYVNTSFGKEFVLDFEGIELFSVSFAQEYQYQKKLSKKKVSEINISDSDKATLNLSKNLFI